MFVNEKLKTHLETEASVRISSKVISEWNMNVPTNILQIGNYRYRPTDEPGTQFQLPLQSFDQNDYGNYYTDATFADIVIDGGLDNQEIPTSFLSVRQKEQQLYSLEDCFGKNRPRSGINKLRYFKNGHSHFANSQMSGRPRYYAASREDVFKYWTSYRKESGVERGIANKTINGKHYIDDSCPYVVYKTPVPANRIIVKMQTGVGNIDLGPFLNSGYPVEDPFYGEQNSQTPVRWKMQYLDGKTWVDAIAFDENSIRPDGSSVIGTDGYVEVSYGPILPSEYSTTFNLLGSYTNVAQLPQPEGLPDGSAYLVQQSNSVQGVFYIAIDGVMKSFAANYGWSLSSHSDNQSTSYVTKLVNPEPISNSLSGETFYKEFQYIGGLRVVVETMRKHDATFDLIELSPRLSVDLSDKTEDFSITKSASDLGVSGMPVSQLLASTGSISLFDYDQAFFSNNLNSIVRDYLSQKVQFKFYEVIKNVDGEDLSVPIKTLYSESFPEARSSDRSVSVELRDLFHYFESQTAPQILAPNASVSYCISLLLDSIGFSNYRFLRLDSESELEIPFFFIAPDTSVAQVLNNIAMSTQSAMFLDEDNNLIIMSKEYMLPGIKDRETDIVLYGTKDFIKEDELKNKNMSYALANIEAITSQNKEIYNSGTINYTSRYIQRSYGSLKQAAVLDRDKTWIYKPALLWEVAPTEQTKPINDEVGSQSSYVLGAIPLNSTLSSEIPRVENNSIVNNIIDLGDGVYWITRYNGYLYANGEIIKYDAVQFSIPGLSAISNEDNIDGDNVWITSVQEYSKYFSRLPFNGKMYPTGLVRIFAEPNYEMINDVTFMQNGEVSKHGRGQFDTKIVSHEAGLSQHWSNRDNVRGCKMDFLYLSDQEIELPETEIGQAGLNHSRARDTSRTGLIKNFLAYGVREESDKDSGYPATVQSSAFVFSGESFASSDNPLEHVSYVYKPLENKFTHFGTRMRIIGKIENSEIRGQSPVGAFTYYTPSETRSDQPSAIAGASGGVAVSINPETNVGYYFELLALTDANLAQYSDSSVNNMLFYKIKKESGADSTAKAIPIPLWSGIGNVLVDDGRFTGQSRLSSSETTTVYDMAVEYKNVGSKRRFFLYVNNVMVAIVDDHEPLPEYNNMALFVRGSSECMFENVYALANNYSQNTIFSLNAEIASAFDVKDISANKSFQKYALSGLIQSTYLSGIGPAEPPKYDIYYEEFGTIMREAAYFNIRYDKAYPALYAKMSPTFNRVKGYTVSNFFARSYGAEFLIFNATDTALSLDSTSGNYLRIQGVTFTQESTNELSVDDYFNNKTDASSIKVATDNTVYSPAKAKQEYFNIKTSRLEHGAKSFSLDSPYIQSHDAAENLMGWMVNKIMKPSRSVGVEMFASPHIQLGDIVQINYKNADGVNEIAPYETRFVVYHVEYKRDNSGPSMQIYLSEVV
jgi:hypothetical protein